jgi:hypothetical protein
VTDGLDKILKDNGFTNEMKLEMFPMGPLSIMLRVENIADIIDNSCITCRIY